MNLENINEDKICVNKTFTEVLKNPKDNKVIKKILDIYAGNKGEFTAVTQYLYESFYTNPNENTKKLSKILNKISICEMRHVQILSQILLSMDVNPKFCKYIDNNYNICNYWSAGNVKYITNIKEFIEYNIKLEEYAINEYNQLLQITTSDNIKEIVNEILEDENNHLTIFKEIKFDLEENISRGTHEEDIHPKEVVTMLSNIHIPDPPPQEIIEDKESISKSQPIRQESQIQIPVLDLEKLTDEDIICKNNLENKTYSPDEIIDG